MSDNAPTVPRLSGQRVALVLGTSLGGVGRHVSGLAQALTRSGAVTTVYGPAATEQTFGFTHVGAAFRPSAIAPGMAPLAAARAARVLAPQLSGTNLVHAHGLRAGLVAAAALRRMRSRSKPPLVVSWHNVPATAARWRQLQTQLERRLVLATDVALAVSPDLSERISAYGARDVRLLPVGAEPLPEPLMTTAAVRAELGATDRPIVLSIGRLHAQKGFDVLLDAAASWRARGAVPLLVIAGDGPDRVRLAEQATAHQVDVRWLGYVENRTRIAELLGVADLVVFASRWEGSPLAVHEALMSGRPVIATAVGGLPSLLRPDEVRFVPPADAAALASAVSRLLDHPAEAAALAAAGRKASKRWPDASATAATVLEVYAGVLAL